MLESAYGRPRDEVAAALDALLRAAQIHYRDKDLLWRALADERLGPGDFADCVIGRDGAAEGWAATVTFDRDLRDEARFEVLAIPAR